MKGGEFKDLVFEQFAGKAQAFAAPQRLEIIDVLAQGERDVDSLCKQVAVTVANTSRHLQVLKRARLVEPRREGVHIFYRLADDDVVKCWLTLQELAEKRSSEIREIARIFFEERDSLESITKEELQKRSQNNEVVILDVRPFREYQKGHISGAVSIPLSELKTRLNELPADKEIIAYCRGPYCVMSAEAMTILNQSGYQAVRLKEGLPEWQIAGMSVE
ncbi:MAG: ArsR/SmtB family transcription factor [Calditrichia bacterium]